jgi:hypothetical protein
VGGRVIAAGAVIQPRLVHHPVRPSGFPPQSPDFEMSFWFVLPSMRPLFVGGYMLLTCLLTEKEVVVASKLASTSSSSRRGGGGGVVYEWEHDDAVPACLALCLAACYKKVPS